MPSSGESARTGLTSGRVEIECDAERETQEAAAEQPARCNWYRHSSGRNNATRMPPVGGVGAGTSARRHDHRAGRGIGRMDLEISTTTANRGGARLMRVHRSPLDVTLRGALLASALVVLGEAGHIMLEQL